MSFGTLCTSVVRDPCMCYIRAWGLVRQTAAPLALLSVVSSILAPDPAYVLTITFLHTIFADNFPS